MARGRKSSYINKLTSKDQVFLKSLRDVGYLSQRHIKEEITLADKRLLNYMRDGYIEKCGYINRQTKESEFVYRLTSKGRTLAETQLNYRDFYKSSSARHDLALADKYFSLSEADRATWRTETEMRKQFKQRIEQLHQRGQHARAFTLDEALKKREISIPDGAYVRDGQIYTVEIVTAAYGTAELAAKEAFIAEAGYKYETIKI